MKVRTKENPKCEFSASKFNIHACCPAEVIGFSDQWGADCFYVKDLDVFIEANDIGWKDMEQTFKDHDIIIDNYNTYFFEPRNEEDKKRGFTLD